MNKRGFGPALGGQLAAGCHTLNRNMTSLPANELDKCALWVFYTTLLENKFKFFKFNYEINLDYPEMIVLNAVLSLGLLSQENLIRAENKSNLAGFGDFSVLYVYE